MTTQLQHFPPPQRWLKQQMISALHLTLCLHPRSFLHQRSFLNLTCFLHWMLYLSLVYSQLTWEIWWMNISEIVGLINILLLRFHAMRWAKNNQLHYRVLWWISITRHIITIAITIAIGIPIAITIAIGIPIAISSLSPSPSQSPSPSPLSGTLIATNNFLRHLYLQSSVVPDHWKYTIKCIHEGWKIFPLE